MHGLEELRAALRAKGIRIDNAKQIDAAKGNLIVVAGLSGGTGPAANTVSESSLTPFTEPESLLVLNDYRPRANTSRADHRL